MLWSLGQVYLYKEFMTYILSIISHPPTLTFHKPNLSILPLSARQFLHICSGQHANVLIFQRKEERRKKREGREGDILPHPCTRVYKRPRSIEKAIVLLFSPPLSCAIPSLAQCVINFQSELCNSYNFFSSKNNKTRRKLNDKY